MHASLLGTGRNQTIVYVIQIEQGKKAKILRILFLPAPPRGRARRSTSLSPWLLLACTIFMIIYLPNSCSTFILPASFSWCASLGLSFFFCFPCAEIGCCWQNFSRILILSWVSFRFINRRFYLSNCSAPSKSCLSLLIAVLDGPLEAVDSLLMMVY